jgi:hypothetical protein
MKRFCVLVLALVVSTLQSHAQDYKEVQRFKAYHANQAVAVGKDAFYAITNAHITKFNMQGDSLLTWHEPDKNRIRHINSGIVLKGKLYCAHSNYPKYPMASSIEIFDADDLEHVGTVSFGIDTGSCTWILPGKRSWYVFFAHYNMSEQKTKSQPDNANMSQLVQFDRKWLKMQAWTVPQALLDEVAPSSLSGAVLIGDTFYCTGHDAAKCYLLKIPERGMNLEWVGEVNVPFHGQGIALAPDGDLWGILRKEKVVIRSSRR